MTDQTAGVGHNISPDYAATITSQLEKDYAELLTNSASLLDEARAMPKVITEESQLTSFATLIDRLRDTAARFKTFHTTEKEPHLRAGQAVDAFFFRHWGKLTRRNKADEAGAADILHARVDAFMQAKLQRERQAREAAAKLAREEEDRLAAAAAQAAQRAVDEAAAAARARKPENIAALQTSADQNKAAAQALLAQLNQASSKADDARIDTLAKPSDMVRTRTDGGQLITMKQVPFVAIEDRTKLDFLLLAPHFKEEHVLMALKAYAKSTDHKTPMAGAIIKMVDETVV